MFMDVVGIFTGVFVVVKDGQHAVKFHLGRAQEVVGVGVHFKWPIIQTFKVKETKDTTLDLETQSIQLRDGLVYDVTSKLVYRIVDLKKALIEVDDLVTGLKNRLTMEIQRSVQAQDRESILDQMKIVETIRKNLEPLEEAWGFRIRELGFSNFSPSTVTLEITQLALLSEEKLKLYKQLRGEGLSEMATVSLISGAVVTLREEVESEIYAEKTEEKKEHFPFEDLIEEEEKEEV